ncbi:hypothetical protein PC121_g14425 [Phytophthora cactorum]|nr:hypothetical protein PC121_g14425 [Phytophthora cactorum]
MSRLYASSVRPGAFIFDSAVRSSVRHSPSTKPTSRMLSSSAVRPFARASPTSVELPKLRVPLEAGRPQQDTRLGYDNARSGYHAAPPVPVKTEGPSGATMPSPHGPDTRSPSSPSSFFTQPEIAKLGLTPLLEAAEQMRPSTTETSPPLYGRSSPLKRELPLQQTLPSIMHAMGGYPLETSAMPKRARIGSDVGLDMQASYSLLGHMPRQAMIYPSSTPHLQQPAYHQQHVASYVPATETQSPGTAGSNSPGTRGLSTYSGASVWETVLASGKFPMDIGLSENGSTGGASPTAPFNPNNIRSASEDAADTIGIDATVELKQVQDNACQQEVPQPGCESPRLT